MKGPGLGLKKLTGNIAATLARQLGAGVLQLLTLALIARVFGPQGNGAYAVALLLPTTLASLLNLGIGSANIYYLGAARVGAAAALRTTFKLYAVIALLGLAVGATVVLHFAERWFQGVPEELLWVALAVFPISLLLALISSVFQGLQQFKRFNLILLLQPSLILIFVILLLLGGVDAIEWMLAAYLAAALATLIVALFTVRGYWVKGEGPAFPHYGRALLTYGYKAHLSNILAFVNYRADIFLVNFFTGPAAAGVYVIAVQLSERLWLLSRAASTVLLPRLSQLSSDEAKRKQLTPIVTRWVLWITLAASLLTALVGYPFILLVFGTDFVAAYWPLVLLLPGIVLGSASRVLANDIAARGRPELNMYTSIVVVLINVAGNVALIPGHGIHGAAVATSLAYGINFALRLAMHRYFTGTPIWRNILIGRSDLAILNSLRKKGGKQ